MSRFRLQGTTISPFLTTWSSGGLYDVGASTATGFRYGGPEAPPILLEHVRAGRLELADLLGERYPLERANEAVEDALAGRGGRVLVTP